MAPNRKHNKKKSAKPPSRGPALAPVDSSQAPPLVTQQPPDNNPKATVVPSSHASGQHTDPALVKQISGSMESTPLSQRSINVLPGSMSSTGTAPSGTHGSPSHERSSPPSPPTPPPSNYSVAESVKKPAKLGCPAPLVSLPKPGPTWGQGTPTSDPSVTLGHGKAENPKQSKNLGHNGWTRSSEKNVGNPARVVDVESFSSAHKIPEGRSAPPADRERSINVDPTHDSASLNSTSRAPGRDLNRISDSVSSRPDLSSTDPSTREQAVPQAKSHYKDDPPVNHGSHARSQASENRATNDSNNTPRSQAQNPLLEAQTKKDQDGLNDAEPNHPDLAKTEVESPSSRRDLGGAADQFDLDAQHRQHAGPGGGMVKEPRHGSLGQQAGPAHMSESETSPASLATHPEENVSPKTSKGLGHQHAQKCLRSILPSPDAEGGLSINPNLLQIHLSYFDTDQDGFLYLPDTVRAVRQLGFGIFISTLVAIIGHSVFSILYGRSRLLLPALYGKSPLPLVQSPPKDHSNTLDASDKSVHSSRQSSHPTEKVGPLTLLRESRRRMHSTDHVGPAQFLVAWVIVVGLTWPLDLSVDRDEIEGVYNGELLFLLSKKGHHTSAREVLS